MASIRSATAASNAVGAATSSTSFHSTASAPWTPSDLVANTSARSRRTWRLSVSRVSPPVPGSTPSSGTSGSDTALDRSSTSRRWSQAIASSYPPPEQAPLIAARKRRPEAAEASSISSRVSLVNLQKLTLCDVRCRRPASGCSRPAQKTPRTALSMTTTSDVGMFESDATDGVGQFDVDADVVAVELQFVVAEQAPARRNVHRQPRRATVDLEVPVRVRVGLTFERDQWCRYADVGHRGTPLLAGGQHTLLSARYASRM